jgi:phosphatidylserine/phosphatidylglycerophosphate/cardiolipin synthase-like enzyme
MDTILTGNIWRRVAPLANRAKHRLLAVAYVSSDKYLKLRRNDILVCDASDRAIQAGETSASLLKSLVRKGAEVRSCPDLHAKVAVLGQTALVGSCNLSASSEEDLTELALLTDRKQIVAQATAFIHNLREASERIGDDFLRRILKLKVRRPRRRRKRQGKEIRFGNKVWLVSVRELPHDSFPKEQPFVEQAEKKAATLAGGCGHEIAGA